MFDFSDHSTGFRRPVCATGTRAVTARHRREVRAEVLAEETSTAFVRIAGRGHQGALAQVYGVFAHDDGAWGHVVIGGADAALGSVYRWPTCGAWAACSIMHTLTLI